MQLALSEIVKQFSYSDSLGSTSAILSPFVTGNHREGFLLRERGEELSPPDQTPGFSFFHRIPDVMEDMKRPIRRGMNHPLLSVTGMTPERPYSA